MIVLDTNVVSEVMKATADPRVIAYLDDLEPDEVALTAVTVAEVRYGISRLPDGRRRVGLSQAAETLFAIVFGGRILPFDEAAARAYGQIAAQREAMGRPISVFDAMIAATCRASSASLATRNAKDFEATGITLADPWA